mmetsp:Transcript_6298/g.17971  ORF Transcript_6298/g.17971 Transcript_6298/m.17971 type:complete len:957 (-) Transcript_6298:312-3182(-)
MVLQALLSGALAYANTAYTYNQGRYQFDAGQAQTSAHLLMNLRMAQWNLFREDIRDLFTLTTSHMSTYMVVGTLFLGFTVSFVWSGIKDFPCEPPWLLLLWGNCFISSLAYGILSVWLAVHGSITAQSSSVKMLAMFIRPPIPSAEEIEQYRHDLQSYEAAGVSTMLQPPDLLGTRPRTKDLGRAPPKQAAGEGAPDDSSSDRQTAGELPGPLKARPSSRPLGRHSVAPTLTSGHAPEPVPSVPAGLLDTLGSPIGSGPGKAANLESHIQLFRKEQASFLSFDGYARVCLSGCACQMLLGFSYFIVAYVLERMTKKESVRWAAALFCWGCTGILIFTTLCLFRLDLWVEKGSMRAVKGLLIMGPLVTSIACELWARGEHMYLVWWLVLLSTVLHFAWVALFLYEARPTAVFNLPMSFRSVRYLDIFGYATREAPTVMRLQEGQVAEELPQVLEDERTAQDEGMQEALHLLLRKGGHAEQLSAAERERLRELQMRCQSSRSPEGSSTSPSVLSRWWLQCEHVADNGQPLPYFLNAWTSEVCWTAPVGARIINLHDTTLPISEMQGSPSMRAPDSETSGMEHFEIEEPEAEAAAKRRPGSSHDQASMPWKYFMQLTLFMIALWIATFVYCIVDRDYLLDRRSRPQITQQVMLSWPHVFFSPVAMTCKGGTIFIGDRFEIYASELPAALPSPPSKRGQTPEPWPLRLQQLFLAEELPGPWMSFDVVCSTGKHPRGCTSLLLLDRNGRTVWEQPLPTHPGDSDSAEKAPPRRWLLGASLEVGLRTIALLDGRDAARHCGGHSSASRLAGTQWALLAATERSEVIVLCPRDGQLQPARRVAGDLQASGVLEVLAVHFDGRGSLWHVTRSTDIHSNGGTTGDTTELGSSAAGGGALPPKAWQLPQNRRWASGLCELEHEGLILAAQAERPELWYMPFPDEGVFQDTLDQRASQATAPIQQVI